MNSRLGIPILYHSEALYGVVLPGATEFPAAVGLGSTWDPELLEKMFATVALESRAAGNVLVLAPVLDLSRVRRGARVITLLLIRPRSIETMCPIHSALFAEWVGGSVAFLWVRISKRKLASRDHTAPGIYMQRTARRCLLCPDYTPAFGMAKIAGSIVLFISTFFTVMLSWN